MFSTVSQEYQYVYRKFIYKQVIYLGGTTHSFRKKASQLHNVLYTTAEAVTATITTTVSVDATDQLQPH